MSSTAETLAKAREAAAKAAERLAAAEAKAAEEAAVKRAQREAALDDLAAAVLDNRETVLAAIMTASRATSARRDEALKALDLNAAASADADWHGLRVARGLYLDRVRWAARRLRRDVAVPENRGVTGTIVGDGNPLAAAIHSAGARRSDDLLAEVLDGLGLGHLLDAEED